MSVVIKGMKMPKSCLHCFCMRGCPAARRRQNEAEPMFPRTYRHDDCPLGDVPTPHGDLIDRDALKENGELVNEDMGLYSYQGIAMDSINSARAIIEAEE